MQIHLRQLRGWLIRLFGLFHRRGREQEFAEELESHLAMHIEDNLRAGMSPEEARRVASVKLGGVTQIKELHREQRGLPMLETLLQDLRFGLRILRKNPGFAAVGALSLALGIGANTALFSVVDAVLLKTLPVAEPERLVMFAWYAGLPFREGSSSGPSNVPAPPGARGDSRFRYEVFDKMRQARAAAADSPLNDLFAFAPLSGLAAVVGDKVEIINGQVVTGGYLTGMRLQPSLGRTITDEDDKPGAAPVVVLSHQFWQERFGANPTVIGQSLKLNKQSLDRKSTRLN